jgi:hypothetical protein
MPSHAHEDIRRMLKEFGLTADETVSAYLLEKRPARPLKLRITLEDLTDYDAVPEKPLRVEVEGNVGP